MAEKRINDDNNCFLKKVRSKYILKQIFNNVNEIITLDIIRYNKSFQKKLNKKINDYKKHYSKIEIDIIPAENEIGEFIHIHNEKLKSYFHIYFDDSKVEIKRNYLNENDNVKIIKIIIDFQIKSFKELFEYCECIEYMCFKKFSRNNINNMGFMFYKCSSLKELNLSNFNTNNVTNMRGMFSGCLELKELNISIFNTINVTDMGYMFCKCSSLKELSLSNFNTNKVTYMRGMFYGCSALKELNISNFNANNVNNIFGMIGLFSGCSVQFQNKIKAKYKNIKEETFN